ncbi:MAG TPA: tripartite tricarboxylate transporter TctB family protein, partial [Alphaproteobacteria bacterium]
WRAGDVGRVVLLTAASLAYPLLLEPIGFVPATSCLCFLGALAFRARPLLGAIAAVVTSFVFLVVIDYLLDLPLPRGPLGI